MNATLSALLAFAFASTVAPGRASAATACDIQYPSDSTRAWHCRRMAAGETLEGLFGARWRDVARFNRMDRRHAWPGALIRVPADLTAIENFSPMPGRYADAESSAKFILIDLREQFLGAYEHGRLVLSFPIASGRAGHDTPAGDFRVDAADARHSSSRYPMEGTSIPYPMHWALRFHRSRSGVAFWIHGRDLPGVPASHGCVGLTDESMQRRYYGRPTTPEIEDARSLFAWAVGTTELTQPQAISPLPVRILGKAPRPGQPALARSEPAGAKLSGRRHIVEGSPPSPLDGARLPALASCPGAAWTMQSFGSERSPYEEGVMRDAIESIRGPGQAAAARNRGILGARDRIVGAPLSNVSHVMAHAPRGARIVHRPAGP